VARVIGGDVVLIERHPPGLCPEFDRKRREFLTSRQVAAKGFPVSSRYGDVPVVRPGQNSEIVSRISSRVPSETNSRRVPQPFRCHSYRHNANPHPSIFTFKKNPARPHNSPTATPDDVFGGQPPRGLLGGGFSKIFDPLYRLSPRPLAEVFAFLEPPSPNSLPTFPGKSRLAPHAFAPFRRGPRPPGKQEPGQNDRKSFLSLMEIIARNRLRVLTKPRICG
jgi:hypothetical protein